MPTPPSDRFRALSLNGACNADRAALPDSLAPPPALERAFGAQAFRGMPFLLGSVGAANVLLLADAPVTVATGGLTARYLVSSTTSPTATACSTSTPRAAGKPTWRRDARSCGGRLATTC